MDTRDRLSIRLKCMKLSLGEGNVKEEDRELPGNSDLVTRNTIIFFTLHCDIVIVTLNISLSLERGAIIIVALHYILIKYIHI